MSLALGDWCEETWCLSIVGPLEKMVTSGSWGIAVVTALGSGGTSGTAEV